MRITKCLALLQNAWSPIYSGKTWPRTSWLNALVKSRSGQRLRILTENSPNIDFYFDNTTPICGDTPDSVVKPDIHHILGLINRVKPDIVISLGTQARSCIEGLYHNKMYLPHPAWRRLTNFTYKYASNWLNEGFDCTIEIKQKINGYPYFKFRKN